MATSMITPRLFTFLKELTRNNDRPWFMANKQRYIEEVRDPLLHFIDQFGSPLAKISKHMVADPRPVGGSLFRIYRDTRFSRDKQPYKTHAAMSFRHIGGRDVHGPGFYVHFEPGNVFMGAGMWHPEPEVLTKVRDAIVAHPKRWERVLRSRGVTLDARHEDDDRLKRPPRGYDPEHRFVEDLKRKSFTASATCTEAQACAPDFIKRFTKVCEQKAPLMEFLTVSVGLPW